MPERAVQAITRFARVVSDAANASGVLEHLGDALFEHVRPDALVICSLEPSGTFVVAVERGLGAKPPLEDVDDLGMLGERVRLATGARHTDVVMRPLVAGGNLFGAAVLLCEGIQPDSFRLELADGLIDLAAIALGTAAHVEQLERQYRELEAHQQMLARTEKLRALGQMAAGISHDLKNILNPISLHLQLVTRSLDRGLVDDAKESAVEMKQIITRGVQTLERLREFSRQEKESRTVLVELDALAREAAAIGKSRCASSGTGRVIRIVDELAPAAAMAVPGEIVSALVNLVVNAVDAGASTVTLRSGTSDADAWVEVRDDGPGMPPEIASRVFEPFFTTKGAEEGTGLGLAMVYASMQRHGGAVTLETEVGRGTAFRLTFPAPAV